MVGSPEIVYRGRDGKWACERVHMCARLVKRNESFHDQLSQLKLPETALSPNMISQNFDICK